MNWLEPIQLMPAAAGGAWTMWIAGAAMLISVAMLAAASFMVLRNHRLRSRLERLERELLVFTEASTRVAQTLEEVLLGRMPSRQSIQTSRRYLLLQARARLHRGESLQGIAR